MLRRVLPVLLVMTAVQANPANALRGNDIYEYCPENVPRETLYFYIGGVMDNETTTVKDPSSRWYCAPQGSTLKQAADIACQYMKEHPGERHYTASVLVTFALKKAWPCPKQ
jgi:hypothetical protein